MNAFFQGLKEKIRRLILSVPVSWKIIGIGILPVLILGVSLNYWVITGLSDWLSYLLTDVRVKAAMTAGSRSVLFVTVLAASFSVLILALLVHVLSRPIQSLINTAEQVAAGKTETRAQVWAQDEFGSLAISINQMIDNLIAVQEDLKQSNRQLEAINRITEAADQQNDIHDVLFITLEKLLELLGLEFGWAYLYDPEIHKYHLASWKNVPEELKDKLLSNKEGELCPSQLAPASPDAPNPIRLISCPRLAAAGYDQRQSRHISIPIGDQENYFGIINLYYPSPDPLDQATLDLLEGIQVKISELVANAWLEIKLKEKESARLLLLQSLVSAQEDERQNLARELHDQAGQSLTSLLIRLKALENQCQEGDIQNGLLQMQDLVADTITEIRDLSYSLRPPALEEFGFITAVRALSEDLASQAGLAVEVKDKLKQELNRDLALVLYRIIQEGLTNVLRHAQATKVLIEIEQLDNLIFLTIDDDGKGFDPARIHPSNKERHLGLISMSERAELIGGSMEMYSAPGQGTMIKIQVPLPGIGGSVDIQ